MILICVVMIGYGVPSMHAWSFFQSVMIMLIIMLNFDTNRVLRKKNILLSFFSLNSSTLGLDIPD